MAGNQPNNLNAANDTRRTVSRFWMRRVVMAVLGGGLLAIVAVLIARGMSSENVEPRLTHTIARGDLHVTAIESGLLESSENTEIKCKVRGLNAVTWVIESGSMVKPGDLLVTLDTLAIEEQIDERTKYAHWSLSGAERSAAEVARSKITLAEYQQGTYVTELMNLEKELAVAESAKSSAQNMLTHAEMMAESGYISKLDVEERQFALEQAKLEVELKQTQIRVLKDFTKAEQLETLQGDFAASSANHKANVERAEADTSRRDRALEEYEYCVIRAERAGLVIHMSAAQWFNAPQIAEGATVHKDQVLLLMPDLSKMRVKVGVHESIIDRIKAGQSAVVTLPERTLDAVVASISPVTAPTGWWTGNEVRYDTFVDLPPVDGLKPGMSAEVEFQIAEYTDVLTVPVAAIVDTGSGHYCWVQTSEGPERRAIQLGDSNDVFTIVETGLKEGDQVILNPAAFGPTTTITARKTKGKDEPKTENSGGQQSESPANDAQKKPTPEKPTTGKPTASKPK